MKIYQLTGNFTSSGLLINEYVKHIFSLVWLKNAAVWYSKARLFSFCLISKCEYFFLSGSPVIDV